jgi:hypothetical protein
MKRNVPNPNIFAQMQQIDDLEHYGTPRHSGRYPWGSGENPYQGDENFQKFLTRERKKGLTNTQIAKKMGISTTKLRAKIDIAGENATKWRDSMIFKLHDKGYNNSAISRQLQIPDTTVGNVLRRENQHKISSVRAVADTLKEAIKDQKYIDVGHGSEVYMRSSKDKMRHAVALLEEEGYEVQLHYQTQMGTGKPTTIKVLCKKGTPWSEVEQAKREAKIDFPNYHFEDRDYQNPHKLETPVSVDSKRIQVVFGDQKLPDGTYGKDRDGLIELRRGCEDLNLGRNHYAQVRIAVDGTHYLKGVAVYNDNLPKGIDIRYNVSKPSTMPLKSDNKEVETVFKRMKPDPVTNNPFGASINQNDTGEGKNQLKFIQVHYKGKDGKEHLSALNIVNEQGTWDEWSRNLPSQFLSKQTIPLATKQLKLDARMRHDDFDEIMSISNAAVRKNLLNSFADNCDSAACHLKAAALPRQATHLIVPFPDMKENEIYAPNYDNGERVALIRFPHAGRFEIAELTVNNNFRHAKEVIGSGGEDNVKNDAVGIHPKVAEKLSGADFDGDTVLVIPNNDGSIKTHPSLKQLDGFADELRVRYKRDPNSGVRHMTAQEKGMQMGLVSNLITDMTLMGAPASEIARAVRHSMVVIDAEKHDLDWRRSLRDNNIEQLFLRYQNRKQGGASTLISRSTSPQEINELKAGQRRIDPATGKSRVFYIDPKTGERLFTETGRLKSRQKMIEVKDDNGNPIIDPKTGRHKKVPVLDENGKAVWEKVPAKETSQKMYFRKDGSVRTDAMELSSGTKMEKVYGEYANDMKALANRARLEASHIRLDHINPVARKLYSEEIHDLDIALGIAKKNAPLERKAQSLASRLFAMKKADNPELEYDKDKKKKAQAQCLEEARYRVGAKKTNIDITDKQWEAIQAGAISGTKLEDILKNTDIDKLKKRALPRTPKGISPAKLATARMRIKNGYTAKEVANSLGVSLDALYRALEEKG